MKTNIFVILLVLTGCTTAYSATDCTVKELADHSELICVGDEKAVPEISVPAKPDRGLNEGIVVQNQTTPQPQTKAPAATSVAPPQSSDSVAETPAESSTRAVQSQNAADRLRMRKIQAEQNTRKLKDRTTDPIPPVQ